MQNLWTAEGDARLRELAAEKLSASRIAEILGVTRNAVIGRCHRAGIQLQSVQHPSYAPGRPPVRRPRKRVLTPGQRRPRGWEPRSTVPLVIEQPQPAFVYTGPGYLFADVPDGGCMFYVNDVLAAPTLFCGEPKSGEHPYCAGHCRIAYPPPSKPRTEAQREASRRAGLAYVRAIRRARKDAHQPPPSSIAARIDEYGVAAE